MKNRSTWPRARQLLHGTVTAYTYGCRCELCRTAKQEYNKTRRWDGHNYRRKKPQKEAPGFDPLDVRLRDPDGG